MQKKIVIMGPAYPLRGGLASFDERLALQFSGEGYETYIYSFSLQYPSFLFPGKTQYSDGPPPEFKNIRTRINSINPLNWIAVGREINRLQPDILLIRFWLPFMGPALGTISRFAKKNGKTKIIALTDNVIPHEKRPGDKPFTKYFLSSCDAFITMSEKVMNDLNAFDTVKPRIQVNHPLYDNFGEPVSKEEARIRLGLEKDAPIILFFGFIRKYKGLDILLQSMKFLKNACEAKGKPVPRLLVAGEFYEDEAPYKAIIENSGIKDVVILHDRFISDEEVKYYLCAADVVAQPYRNATQSGVTPLSYHFEKPMVVTSVGSLPQMVPHEKAGLVTEPDPEAFAHGLEQFFEYPEGYFLPFIKEEKKKFTWNVLTAAISGLHDKLIQ
jgi:glycosyltransferase involved in cell wall biosynthesis